MSGYRQVFRANVQDLGRARKFLRFIGKHDHDGDLIIAPANYYAEKHPERYATWVARERLLYGRKVPD